jgi:hypothetical protein
VAECVLFWLAYGKLEEFGKRSMWQDFATIVVANLASFIGGEILNAYGWLGLLTCRQRLPPCQSLSRTVTATQQNLLLFERQT